MIVSGIAAVLLGACGQDARPLADFDGVVARVNGQEITVHQLNEQLTQSGLSAGVDAGSARKQLLDSLIDEQLLVQKALSAGLDRNPATRTSIERATRQLLAQAAIEASFRDADVSTREVRTFYGANPNLFEKRKIFTFRRFVLEQGKLDRVVKARLDLARTAADVGRVLKASGIPYGYGTEVRTAESLPSGILDQAAGMESGDILLFAEGSRTILMQLAGSVPEPVALESAVPSIRSYLADAKNRKKAERLVKELRREAQIEYITQTAGLPTGTTLAESKPALDEPPPKKPLQSQQVTVIR